MTVCWVERPDNGRVAGVNPQLYAAGKLLHVKVSVLLSPSGAIVITDVACALMPESVSAVVDAEMPKPAVGVALTSVDFPLSPTELTAVTS